MPILFFSYTTSDTLKQYFKETNEKELLNRANKIAGNIQKGNYLKDKTKKNSFDNEVAEKSVENSARILILDNKGFVVKDSNKIEEGKLYAIPEVISALNGLDVANLRDDEEAIYATAYIEDDDSKKIGVVLLVSSFQQVNALIDNVRSKWFLVTLGICIIVACIVFFTTQVFIGPLKNILKVIKKITDGQLHQRIIVEGNDEYFQLGEAFNNMTEQLESIETSRQEFVSNVSHELKTPLSSIKVLSESILLQEEMPIEMYREFLRDINSEVDRMTNIINDLLELVKLDHKEAGLNIKENDIKKMTEDIIKRLYPLAERKNIEILYENNKNMIIEGDEVKLTLALSNLVENGIKYTPEGGTVKVTVDGDHQNCFISVQDTGIGISEEEQSKVFKRFYRVDKTRDRETGGTGLGLAITHSSIMLHNGSIKINSKENEGATFIVRLPIKYSEC